MRQFCPELARDMYAVYKEVMASARYAYVLLDLCSEQRYEALRVRHGIFPDESGLVCYGTLEDFSRLVDGCRSGVVVDRSQ